MIAFRETKENDFAEIAALVQAAFNSGIEADLTRALLADPTAAARLSLMAQDGDHPVGHILFTKAGIASAKAVLLAPLSVHPVAQGQGVGGKLIDEGVQRLTSTGTDLVFVLGDPAYYSPHGFKPALQHGFRTPHPIPEEHADAWMVLALTSGALTACGGTVRCAAALDAPELWAG